MRHPIALTAVIAPIVVSLALPLSGCVGLHSNQPVQQQYLLSLPPATTPAGVRPGAGASGAAGAPGAAAAAGNALEVLLPVASPGLGGEGIAVIRPGQRLDDYAGVRWAVAAPAMLQTLAIEALRRQGQFSLVESDTGPFATSYVLNLELTHFEADYTAPAATGSESGANAGAGAAVPTVHVTLVCTLGRRAGRNVLTTLTVDSHVQAEADRMRAVIAAFQRATDEVMMRMADQIVPVSAVPAVPAGPASSTSPAQQGPSPSAAP